MSQYLDLHKLKKCAYDSSIIFNFSLFSLRSFVLTVTIMNFLHRMQFCVISPLITIICQSSLVYIWQPWKNVIECHRMFPRTSLLPCLPNWPNFHASFVIFANTARCWHSSQIFPQIFIVIILCYFEYSCQS